MKFLGLVLFCFVLLLFCWERVDEFVVALFLGWLLLMAWFCFQYKEKILIRRWLGV